MVLQGARVLLVACSDRVTTDVLRVFTARRSTIRTQRRTCPALHLRRTYTNVFDMSWMENDATITALLDAGIGNPAAFAASALVLDTATCQFIRE
jgi:hypothetical protein